MSISKKKTDQMKTIREHIHTLPEPLCEKALKAAQEGSGGYFDVGLDFPSPSLATAIASSINLDKYPEFRPFIEPKPKSDE